jgi:hypothetical protein
MDEGRCFSYYLVSTLSKFELGITGFKYLFTVSYMNGNFEA